jgi:hypothetical protein
MYHELFLIDTNQNSIRLLFTVKTPNIKFRQNLSGSFVGSTRRKIDKRMNRYISVCVRLIECTEKSGEGGGCHDIGACSKTIPG